VKGIGTGIAEFGIGYLANVIGTNLALPSDLNPSEKDKELVSTTLGLLPPAAQIVIGADVRAVGSAFRPVIESFYKEYSSDYDFFSRVYAK
jgi:hypothetical protein